MWVITVYQSVEEYRDYRLSQLFEAGKLQKKWLRKDGRKFYETTSLSWVEYWKTSTAPAKIVNEWSKLENKRDYRNRFSSIWGGHLVVEKLSQEEWNFLINQKVQDLKSRMSKQLSDLERERLEYKSF